MAEPTKKRCLVCGQEKVFEGSICPGCQERIRGEAAGRKKEEKADADRALRREGVDPRSR